MRETPPMEVPAKSLMLQGTSQFHRQRSVTRGHGATVAPPEPHVASFIEIQLAWRLEVLDDTAFSEIIG
ncbi:unnamed protein product [Leptosia nina]|uniref:Uncharacterized protein n=1 Tax=Leptosia nina TaxID=320188 RepID=A0AAV1J6X4_9NEOP